MHLQRTNPNKRSGFTLVELMVVILIISILSALLTMAVSRGIATAKRTRNRVDIGQLASAVETFKSTNKIEYLPSRILLCESGNYTLSFPLHSDSLAYLQRLWPKLSLTTSPVNWSGRLNFSSTPQTGQFLLEGDQCLVFFLGGIPQIDAASGAPTCTGFSTNPTNPAAHLLSGGAAAKPPFFEFDSSRLVSFHSGTPRFLSYLDTYGLSDGKAGYISGKPYAYFSSYQSRNHYQQYASSDCLTLGVFPYAQGISQFMNPTGFQIISAGADGKFGPGTASNPVTISGPFWTPATAANSAASGPDGADDQANFYESTLGTQTVN